MKLFLLVPLLLTTYLPVHKFDIVSPRDIFPGKNDVASGLTILSPVSRVVYQRTNDNNAMVPVTGHCPAGVKFIDARLVARSKDEGTTTNWKKNIVPSSAGIFSVTIEATGGWYNLEVNASTDQGEKWHAVVERVGIGEVFVVVGHSVAQGGEINAGGSSDDRVSTVKLNEKDKIFDSLYLTSGDPAYLPDPVFVKAGAGVAQAPFAHGTYFWSRFGELIAKKENVPVLIYNAAFGGTNLEHWAKSSQGIQFEHGFVRSGIRMPYINLLNTFKKYIPLTGLRALLADHGQNDAGEKDPEKILKNYEIFLAQARKDLGFSELALVVNRQMPANAPSVRKAQEEMIEQPYCFPGPDYDKDLLKEDKYDGIHLSQSGVDKAAVLWADALTAAFFRESTPYIPDWKLK